MRISAVWKRLLTISAEDCWGILTQGNGVSVQLADKLLAAHVLMLFVKKLHTDPVSPQ
jgi:hypothetical protein